MGEEGSPHLCLQPFKCSVTLSCWNSFYRRNWWNLFNLMWDQLIYSNCYQWQNMSCTWKDLDSRIANKYCEFIYFIFFYCFSVDLFISVKWAISLARSFVSDRYSTESHCFLKSEKFSVSSCFLRNINLDNLC